MMTDQGKNGVAKTILGSLIVAGVISLIALYGEVRVQGATVDSQQFIIQCHESAISDLRESLAEIKGDTKAMREILTKIEKGGRGDKP